MAGRVSKLSDDSYKDNYTNQVMNVNQFVVAIQAGMYPKYYVKRSNGRLIPVSKPDKTKNNNLD